MHKITTFKAESKTGFDYQLKDFREELKKHKRKLGILEHEKASYLLADKYKPADYYDKLVLHTIYLWDQRVKI